MGFSSQSGKVVVRSQAVDNVLQADMGTAGVGLLLRSGSLAIQRDLLTLDPEIGGGRDTADAYLGPASYAGTYDLYPRFKSLPTLLRAGFGVSASTALVAGVATHTITPTDSGKLPFLSVFEDIAGGLQRTNYWDAVVNSMHFEAEPSGFLMGSCDMIARKAAYNATDPDPTNALVDNTAVAVGTSVVIKYGGLTLPAKSFSLDINNNVEDDDWRLGSFDLGDLTAKQREVTGSFDFRHASDAAMFRQAALGKATATAVGGETTKDEMKIDISAYDIIPGSTNVPYSLSFTIPFTIFSPFSLDPSGDDVMESSIDFTGLRKVRANPIISAVVKNGTAIIA